jgi:hypothetical protein
MKFTPTLPKSVPASLQIQQREPSVLVKARTHESKAEQLRQRADDAALLRDRLERDKKTATKDQDIQGPPPHLEYLERWRALEVTVTPIEPRVRKEYAAKLGHDDVKGHEVIGHLIGSLPRARLDVLCADPNIAELNVLLGHRPMQKVIDNNEMLQDAGIGYLRFVDAKRDLKFSLGINTYRSAQALAMYLSVVRAAVDPKVRKSANFVSDVEVLRLATKILRNIMSHVVEEMQLAHDTFFAVGDRRAVGEQFRLDKSKKSGRAAPAADAAKGRPSAALPKPSAGARKA